MKEYLSKWMVKDRKDDLMTITHSIMWCQRVNVGGQWLHPAGEIAIRSAAGMTNINFAIE